MPDDKTEETPEINPEEVLSAMDEGIAEVSPHLEPEEDDTDGADDDAGTAAEEPEPDGEADTDEADEGAAADEDGEAAEDDADSEETDSDDSSDPDKKDAEGDAEGEDAAAVGDEPDHINDPIPESTNEKTAERIKSLIEIAKQQTARGDQGDEIVATITATGADPEQFTNTLGFLAMYNSQDPEQRRKALEVARGVVQELSIELGEGSADLVSKHADLQARVEEGTLSEADAVELATVREQKALREQREAHARTTGESKKAADDAVAAGKQALSAYGASMADDPTYQALYPQYVPLLRKALRYAHPSDYGNVAKDVYEELAANFTPAPKPAPKPTKQPLRAKGGAGGSSGTEKDAEPKSAIEAMEAALSHM